MLDESNELLSLSGDCFSHCVLLQCTIGNGEIVENGMYCFKKKKKKIAGAQQAMSQGTSGRFVMWELRSGSLM